MSVEWVILAVLILPAFAFSVRNSPALIDYAVCLYVFNREIRRLIDWHQGAFNPVSPISLAPLVIVALLLLPFIARFNRLHSMPKQAFVLLFLSITYGCLIGLARNGLACVYAAAEYLSPVALMGYAAVVPADERTADRWLRTAGWATIATCIYGWYQYLTIPPWDAFWVKAVGFVGYLGALEPTKMTVFCTFAERGPCAAFLAVSAIPMLVSRRWRLLLGWPEAILIVSVILLTLARAGVILIALAVVVYPILNHGKGSVRLILMLAVCGVALSFGLDRLPGADRLNKRFSNMNLKEDTSYQARLDIVQMGPQIVTSNPLGYGIGSSGLAGRINTNSAFKTDAVVIDNGYFEVLTSLGLPGGACFAAGLALIWRYLSRCTRYGLRDDFVTLGRVFFLTFLAGMTITNFFVGITVMWIALGRALSPVMLTRMLPPEPSLVRTTPPRPGWRNHYPVG